MVLLLANTVLLLASNTNKMIVEIPTIENLSFPNSHPCDSELAEGWAVSPHGAKRDY
jgi:hypothetical protein